MGVLIMNKKVNKSILIVLLTLMFLLIGTKIDSHFRYNKMEQLINCKDIKKININSYDFSSSEKKAVVEYKNINSFIDIINNVKVRKYGFGSEELYYDGISYEIVIEKEDSFVYITVLGKNYILIRDISNNYYTKTYKIKDDVNRLEFEKLLKAYIY